MTNTYILESGDKGQARLELQNYYLFDTSLQHLKNAGLKEGMTVLDMACGVGAMTTTLAKAVGPHGKVYAFDVSEEQLKLAREKILAEKLDNVIFLQGDINSNSNLPKNIFDLVYMRFLLMHLKEPELAVSNVKEALKPGGVIVSQESIMKTMPVLSYAEAVIDLGKYEGVDYNIGERLQDMYQNAGFTKVEIEYKQLRLSGSKLKQLLTLGLAEWKDKALEAKVVTLEKMAILEEEIAQLSEDIDYPLGKGAYVLAWNI